MDARSRAGLSAPGRPAVRTFLDVDADRLDQVRRRARDLGDRGLERLLVAGAGLAIAAELADVLAGGGLQFAGRRRFARATEGLDASAHAATVGRMRPTASRPRPRARIVRLAWPSSSASSLALAVDVVRSRRTGSVARAARGCRRRTCRSGERVDIGGRSLYLDCRGEGSPTVVLEAGMGSGRRAWAPVLDALAATTRTCAYDRAGRGSSDPRGRHTLADTADDLRVAARDRRRDGAVHRWSATRSAATTSGCSPIDTATRWRASSCVDTFDPDLEAAWIHPLLGDPAARVRGAASMACGPRRERRGPRLGRVRAAASRAGWPALPIEVLRAPRDEPRLDAADERGDRRRLIASLRVAVAGRVRYEIAWGAGHIVQVDRPDLVIAATRRLVDAAPGRGAASLGPPPRSTGDRREHDRGSDRHRAPRPAPHPEGGWYAETWRARRAGRRAAELPARSSTCSPRASDRTGIASMRRRSGSTRPVTRSSCASGRATGRRS